MTIEPWKKKVDIFRSRFIPRDDKYYVYRTLRFQNKDDGTWQEKLSPVAKCSNYGDQRVCLISQGGRGGCQECTNKAFAHLDDQAVWKHINNEELFVLPMLRPDGLRFGAVDFDRGTVFEDAKAIRDKSVEFGIPAYIARSTKKGYHVYWFFGEAVKAHEFTSYIRFLYEELGFYQRQLLMPEIGLPEVFPKQTAFKNESMSNGIKPPMIDVAMKEGKNCWVDDFAVPIPLQQQWSYLEKTQTIKPDDFRKVLTDKEVEILEAPASSNRQRARQKEGKEDGGAHKIIPFGDFWSVVEGCPAMQEYWSKDEFGKYVWDSADPVKGLFHDARFASMALAIHTTNGVDEIKNRWQTTFTDQQVSHAQATSYIPMSCNSMQAKGVCKVGRHPKCGDHCLKRLPPVEYFEGQRKENPDGLAPEMWPEPSPIRFATDRRLSIEDVELRLTEIFKALKSKSRTKRKIKNREGVEIGEVFEVWLPSNPPERIEALLRRAWSLGQSDFKRVRSLISSNKWMKETELKAFEKKMNKEKDDSKDQIIKQTGKFAIVGASKVFVKDGGYWRSWYDGKGVRQEVSMTNFYVVVHEDRALLRPADGTDIGQVDSVEDRTIRGTIYTATEKFPFEMTAREWSATAETYFGSLFRQAGTRLSYCRSDLDYVRNGINLLSMESVEMKKLSRQIGYHTLNSKEVYLMPSVIVDKDGIKPNDVFGVEPFADDSSKPLDFRIIDEEEFKSLSRHIVEDLFKCNSSVLTMTAFAHAMAAVILPQVELAVGYSKSPVLWLGGSYSGGKSFVAIAVQFFFGTFKMLQNSSGTAKGKLANAFNFRHAFMLIDDYKKKYSDPWGIEMPQLVQMTYDRTGRPALGRDGVQRKKVDRARGLLCITGEDVIEDDSAALSRLLLIDSIFNPNFVHGRKVLDRMAEYSGFTPYFVQYCLGLEKDDIEREWDKYYHEFYDPVQNAHVAANLNRVCENLTLNMMGFRLSMEMIASRGAISEVHRDELCKQHQGNLMILRQKILRTAKEASGARVFLEGLKEMIQAPAQYEIFGWPGHSGAEHSTGTKQIGFWRAKTPDVIYIFPQTTHGLVADLVRKNSKTVQTLSHVARQLFEEGHLKEDQLVVDSGRYSVQIRTPNKTKMYCWPVRVEAVGLEPPNVDNKGRVRKESSGNQAGLAIVSENDEDSD